MSIRSQGRRQARQMKQAGKWDSLISGNKKGQVPARTQPYSSRHHDILKPSREGLAALPE